MSKQANPTLIGAFVVGAIAIFAVFAVIIGGDSFNRKSERFVVFFDESVRGLRVGSNVMFRGVPIGVVAEIKLLANATTGEFYVPVYVDIYEGSIKPIPGTERTPEQRAASDSFNDLLDRGLRASLKPESLITGQLYIELDFFPGESMVMRGFNDEFREIPSVTTGMQAIIENAQTLVSDIQESIDIKQVSKDVAAILEGLDQLVNDPATQEVPQEINATLAEVRRTLENANNLVAGASDDAGNLGKSLTATLAELEQLLTTVNERLSDNSNTTYTLDSTLKEVERAARSIRVLTEYLETNPEALVQGKGAKK